MQHVTSQHATGIMAIVQTSQDRLEDTTVPQRQEPPILVGGITFHKDRPIGTNDWVAIVLPVVQTLGSGINTVIGLVKTRRVVSMVGIVGWKSLSVVWKACFSSLVSITLFFNCLMVSLLSTLTLLALLLKIRFWTVLMITLILFVLPRFLRRIRSWWWLFIAIWLGKMFQSLFLMNFLNNPVILLIFFLFFL